jgi:hypothetical protein
MYVIVINLFWVCKLRRMVWKNTSGDLMGATGNVHSFLRFPWKSAPFPHVRISRRRMLKEKQGPIQSNACRWDTSPFLPPHALQKSPKPKPLSPSSSRLADSLPSIARSPESPRRFFAPPPLSPLRSLFLSPTPNQPMEALAGSASSSILPARHPPSRVAAQSLALRPSRCGPLRAAGAGGGKDDAQTAPAANGSPVLKVTVSVMIYSLPQGPDSGFPGCTRLMWE